MAINKDKKFNDSPDILIDSPLLDSQLLKLKIQQTPHVFENPFHDSQLLRLQIEQDPKKFRSFFLGHF